VICQRNRALLTTVAVLAPPLLACQAGRSVGRTRTVALGLLLVMAVLHAVLAGAVHDGA
jgi:hypothetical protein